MPPAPPQTGVRARQQGLDPLRLDRVTRGSSRLLLAYTSIYDGFGTFVRFDRKGADGLRQQVAVFHGYYHFGLPHASVRQPLPQPESTHGTGSTTQWRPCPPATAAGLTDHVWTRREVLLLRVPPWPQPAGV
jgi:hypothetical protein